MVDTLLASGGLEIEVVAGESPSATEALGDWLRCQPQLMPIYGARLWSWCPRLPGLLGRANPDIVHIQGLWRYHAWASARWAESRGVPFVVSPRGMLEPWVLRQGKRRKAFAMRMYQRRLLNNAACVVVTSEMEARGARRAGVTAPIAIVYNGIDLPEERKLAFGPMRRATNERRVLFLSRIEPKKGLLELLRAWKSLAPQNWQLIITGPDIDGYFSTITNEIKTLELGRSVTMTGALWGPEKDRILAESEVFVLPSHSENFGLAIGEALAAGLPVITTRATPWHELQSERCGWWIEVGEAPLRDALRDAMAREPSELALMGRRGRNLIASRYSWPAVAREMRRIYEWVGGASDARAEIRFHKDPA